MSAAVEFTSVREAREHLKEFLDAATTGRPATVSRDLQRLAIVDVAPLLDALEKGLPARAEVVAEEGGWSIFLPGLPIAADGTDLEQAVDEMVDALRDYAEAWSERLRLAPNHRGNWALVQFVALADDERLASWITS